MKKMFIAVVLCISLIMVGGNAFAQSAVANVESVTAAAGAEQDQAQQQQNVYNPIDNSIYTNRQFVNPGVTPMPMTNGFFTSPTPDSSFRSIRELLDIFGDGTTLKMTEGALMSLAKGGKVDTNFQVINDENRVKRAYNKDFKGDRWLWITIQKPDGFEPTAIVDCEADHGDTNSFHVLGRMGLKALKDGNNVMVITSEGAHRMVQAKGWGIGLYVAGGVTSSNGKEAISPGGGTGYAQNTSGTEDMPWLQGYVGNEIGLLATLPVVTEEMIAVVVQTGNHTKHGSIQ